MTNAWSIATDCDANTKWFGDLDDALTEAQDIASYAQTRWQGRPTPRPGTLLQDMLGASSEDDATLQTAASKQTFRE